MDVPPGWHETDSLPQGVLAVLTAEGDGVAPVTAVLTREPESLTVADLARWTDAVRRALVNDVPRVQILDVEQTLVGGRPARRLLAHYPAAPVGGHVLEQWLIPDDEGGLVLSCTAPTLGYDDALAATFARIAEGVPGAAR